MTDIAIKAEKISKRYRIGLKEEMHDSLFGAMASWTKSPLKNFKQLRKLSKFKENEAAKDIIWALKDISFEVKQGEIIGIIGRNGAGKSTLLKILSCITNPTLGRAIINGRVASLLEVGTGFHPELTGRENIYLNATILGMSKKEVDRKFDEIVAFSEVEKFIDTPVKRYSSGMNVRLAFAVAAHLEPEILLVDEVLSVGDAKFQKKSIGKMNEISKGGRTVLFVSHNMAAILNLCETAYWLDNGYIKDYGEVSQLIQRYLSEGIIESEASLINHPNRSSKRVPLLRKIRLLHEEIPTSTFRTNGSLTIEIECQSEALKTLSFGFAIKDATGSRIFATNMKQYNQVFQSSGDCDVLRVNIEKLPLTPGYYGISLYFGCESYDLDSIENAINFDVLWDKAIDLATPPQPNWGPLYIPVMWESRKINQGTPNGT